MVTTVVASPATPDQGGGAGVGFSWPSGLAWDAAGVLYIADEDNVRRFDPASGALDVVAGAFGERAVVDDVGAAARFDAATDLALDGTGRLLVSERGGSGRISAHAAAE